MVRITNDIQIQKRNRTGAFFKVELDEVCTYLNIQYSACNHFGLESTKFVITHEITTWFNTRCDCEADTTFHRILIIPT